LAFAGSLGFGGLLSAVVLASRIGGGNMAEALLIATAMVLGGLVGWCLADVLMGKSIRAFMRHWKGALLYAALMALFVMGAELDVTGYEKRLPDPADVARVYVSCSDGWADLDEPENIEQAMALHESIIQNRAVHEQEKPENGRYITVSFSYSGPADETGLGETLMNRFYCILITDEMAADTGSDVMQLQTLLNSMEAIRERKEVSLPVTVDTIYHASITPYEVYDAEPYQLELTAEEAYELYTQCLLPDVADGTLGRIWIVTDDAYQDTVYNLQISLGVQQPRPGWTVDGIAEREPTMPGEAYAKEIPYQYDHFSTVPTVDSWRTNAWLESHGVPMETLREAYERTE
jgi:ABC-2 type transport system permease protein